MKTNEQKLTWEELQQDERAYMPEGRFSKAYNTIMRQIVCETNLQTGMFYYILYSHYNSQDKSCFPNMETLAIECGVSTKTIQTMVKALKDKGFITYTSGKQGRSNNYKFPLEIELEKKLKAKSKQKTRAVTEQDLDLPF